MRFLITLAALFAAFGLLAPKVKAQASNISGKWHFVLDTEGGDREIDAEFQQHSEKVTGTWEKWKVQGTFADGKLNLEFPIDSDEAGPGTLTIKGQLEGEALTGTWAFQTYDGKFKATRTH